MTYRMQGRFFEACDCFVPCPCWFDSDPNEAECSGVIAWQIENGVIDGVDGVDVSGLSVVSVSQHGGHRSQPHQIRVAMVIDEHASDAQAAALESAFTGALGGPLGELANLTSRRATVVRAPIEFVDDDGAARLEVPRWLSVRSKIVRGSTKKPITIGDGQLASLLGTPGYVGRSSRFRLTVGGNANIDVAVENRSTTSGRFSYAS